MRSRAVVRSHQEVLVRRLQHQVHLRLHRDRQRRHQSRQHRPQDRQRRLLRHVRRHPHQVRTANLRLISVRQTGTRRSLLTM